MRKLLVLIVILRLLTISVNAIDLEPPDAPVTVDKYIPENIDTFGKDLWFIFKRVFADIFPGVAEAFSICAAIIVLQLLVSIVQSFSGVSKQSVILAGVIALSIILLGPSRTMISSGIETIQNICEYNKLLLPVMTAALAAQGGSSTSAALYAGTVVLDSLLSIMIAKVILPMLYAYIAIGIASAAVNGPILDDMLSFMKWAITWMLKITIYVFTGYMGITGVISGTTDAAALKATKLTISGMVPVVGGVISDASETVLVGAAIVKNSVGIYGLLVILTMWMIPFLKLGIQYLALKITEGIVSLYSDKQTTSVVKHFSSAMGFLLAMISTVSLLFLISVVCFMKGMS